jgi:hypothetical protein
MIRRTIRENPHEVNTITENRFEGTIQIHKYRNVLAIS